MTPTRMGSLVMDDVHVRTVFSVDEDDEDDEKREVALSHGEWTGYSVALPLYRSSSTWRTGMICDCRDQREIDRSATFCHRKRVRPVLRLLILRQPIMV
jgi:hypothetical protein